jgi:ribosomal-protein-serine acetyltransferase
MLQIPARSDLRLRPILTERLILAPLEGADAQDLWRAVDASRMHLAPWLSWVPFVTDAEASFRFADGSSVDWDQGRACRFTVRDRQHHGLLGVVSFEDLQHLHRSCSLGYWLRHDVVRRGFMTEAARAGVRWAFGILGAHRVSVAAATQNAGSLAVIHRLGFHFEGIARQAEFCAGRWLDHARFSLLTTDVRDL